MENIKDLVKKTKHLKVLFVEDEEDIRDSVQVFFKKFVDEFYLAKNGEEGLNIFKEINNIDVVITDIIMPKMNGIEMIEQMKQINPNFLVIIVSATEENDIDTKTSCDLRIKKPILFDDIKLIIQKISEI